MIKLLKKIVQVFKKKENTMPAIEEQKPEKIYKISETELIAAGDDITEDCESNFKEFHKKVNEFRDKCGIPMFCTSFFRSKTHQISIYKNKAKNKEFPFEDGIYKESKVPFKSFHMKALAGDFADGEKKLAKWVLDNLDWCEAHGFYFENFGYNFETRVYDKRYDKTPTWLHLQIRPPKSGKTIFNP